MEQKKITIAELEEKLKEKNPSEIFRILPNGDIITEKVDTIESLKTQIDRSDRLAEAQIKTIESLQKQFEELKAEILKLFHTQGNRYEDSDKRLYAKNKLLELLTPKQ